MNIFRLALRGLVYYAKSNSAIVLGVAVAISALTGSLLVGNSVKENLKSTALSRLNNVKYSVTGLNFFTENIEKKLNGEGVLLLPAVVKNPANELVVPETTLYGVKDGFNAGEIRVQGREVVINEALSKDLGAKEGALLVIRLPGFGIAPSDSLFGGKDIEETMTSIPVSVKAVIKDTFSLRNSMKIPRNIYLDRFFLSSHVKKAGMLNCVLVRSAGKDPSLTLRESVGLEDFGIKTIIKPGLLVLESSNMVFNSEAVTAAEKAAKENYLELEQISVYLFNSMSGKVPYSVVFGSSKLYKGRNEPEKADDAVPELIVLGSFAAEDIPAKIGDTLSAKYYELKADSEYVERDKTFRVVGIEPQEKIGAKVVIPDFSGMTDAKNIAGWKAPFPVNLSLIRPKDELFWSKYKTAPKAMISFSAATGLWKPSHSGVTALSVNAANEKERKAFINSFLSTYNFPEAGIIVTTVLENALKSSKGSTDYAMLFVSLSFIIVLSALWLVAYLFRIMLEARTAQTGILLSVGLSKRDLLRLFIFEGGLLVVLGSFLALPVSLIYAKYVLLFLKPLMPEGGFFIVHPDPTIILTGLLAGIGLALLAIYAGVRSLVKVTAKDLLAGKRKVSGWVKTRTVIVDELGLTLRALAFAKKRSLLTCGLFASAAFLLVTIALNKPLGFSVDTLDKTSGAYGYNLLLRSKLSLYSDLNTEAGRKKSGFASFNSTVWRDVSFLGCKESPSGDDVSCLNMNMPVLPKLLGVPETIYSVPVDEENTPIDMHIRALADSNSLEWILHKKVGDSVLVTGKSGKPEKVTFVSTLNKSVFADVIVVREKDFNKIYGGGTGYNYFLIRTSKENEVEAALLLRKELGKLGYTVTTTKEILASYGAVQNIYLYTFQILGGIGFLLGTFGIIAVLLQNVFERRKEFAIKTALGFKRSRLVFQLTLENGILLTGGLVWGSFLAVIVSLPNIIQMQSGFDIITPVMTLLLMLALGLVSASIAAYYALRGDLMKGLRRE